jgi:hypothetical protein
MSLLPYVNADTRKDELNRQFRIKFPRIRKAITLSKIRRLKKDMVKIFLNDPTMLEGFTAYMDELEPKMTKDEKEVIDEEEEVNQQGRPMTSYIEVYSLA